MEDTIHKQLESLLESVADYSKTSFELVKLKLLDRIIDVVSSFIPYIIVLSFFGLFIFFVNLGLAFWLSKVFDSFLLGFGAVAVFYGILGFIFWFPLHKRVKKCASDSLVKLLLK